MVEADAAAGAEADADASAEAGRFAVNALQHTPGVGGFFVLLYRAINLRPGCCQEAPRTHRA